MTDSKGKKYHLQAAPLPQIFADLADERVDQGLVKRERRIAAPTLRCTGKSAEVIDGKGVARAPLRERVRNRMKTKKMNEAADFAELRGLRARNEGGG